MYNLVKLHYGSFSRFSMCENHLEGCAHSGAVWGLVGSRDATAAPGLGWSFTFILWSDRRCSSGGAGSLLAHPGQVGFNNRREEEEEVSLGWEQEVCWGWTLASPSLRRSRLLGLEQSAWLGQAGQTSAWSSSPSCPRNLAKRMLCTGYLGLGKWPQAAVCTR